MLFAWCSSVRAPELVTPVAFERVRGSILVRVGGADNDWFAPTPHLPVDDHVIINVWDVRVSAVVNVDDGDAPELVVERSCLDVDLDVACLLGVVGFGVDF